MMTRGSTKAVVVSSPSSNQARTCRDRNGQPGCAGAPEMSSLPFIPGILPAPLGNPGLTERTLVEEGCPPYRCVVRALIVPKPASKGTEASGDLSAFPALHCGPLSAAPDAPGNLKEQKFSGQPRCPEQKRLRSLPYYGECPC